MFFRFHGVKDVTGEDSLIAGEVIINMNQVVSVYPTGDNRFTLSMSNGRMYNVEGSYDFYELLRKLFVPK